MLFYGINNKKRPVIRPLDEDIFIIFLACLSLGLLTVETQWSEFFSNKQMLFLHSVDITIALVFLLEFLYRAVHAPNIARFALYNWWHLLASVPVTALPFQALRGLMILRVVGVVARFFVSLSRLFTFLTKTRLAPILSIFAFFLVSGSLAFHVTERGVNDEVETYWDSLFLSVSYLTNTGGDGVPATMVGEAIGMILMISGVLTLGVFTAYIASHVINRQRQGKESET